MKIRQKTVTYRTTGNIAVRVDALVAMIKSVPPLMALFKFLGGGEVKITRAAVHDPRAPSQYRWSGGNQSTISAGGVRFFQLWPIPPVNLYGLTSYDFVRREPSSTYTTYDAATIDTYREYIMYAAASGVQRTRGDYPYTKGGDTAHAEITVAASAPEFSPDGVTVFVDYLQDTGWVDPLIPASYSTGYVDPQKDAEVFVEFCIPGEDGTEVLVPAVFVIRRSALPQTLSRWRNSWTSLAVSTVEVVDFLRKVIAISNADRSALSACIPYIKLPGLFLWDTSAPMFKLSTFIQGSETDAYIGTELPPSGELYIYEHHTDIQTEYALHEEVEPESWVTPALALALDVPPKGYIPSTEVNTETIDNGVRVTTFKPPILPTQTCCIANLDQSNATGVTGYFCATPETVANLSYVLDPGTMSRLTNMWESM